MSEKTIGKPTQKFLAIKEIRNDCLVLKDGTLRGIIAVSSTNFDLKSQDEQNALIYAYQRFLNSLEFPIQILVQSRRIDIRNYLDTLHKKLDMQSNELMRIQTEQYIEFIEELVRNANVMSKSFFVIIPYATSIEPIASGFFASLFSNASVKQLAQRDENFRRIKMALDERLISVQSNLQSVGLRCERLQTDSLIELVYNSYNIDNGPSIEASTLDNITLQQEGN